MTTHNDKSDLQELREGWLNNGYWIGESIDKDLIPEAVMNKMADYWIEKIKERDRNLVEKLNDMVAEEPSNYPTPHGQEAVYGVLEKVISIINDNQSK